MSDFDRPFLSASQAVHLAKRYGHDSIADFQRWHGLVPDDDPGPVTQSVLLAPRCGVPETFGAEPAQWPRDCLDVTCAYRFSRRLNLDDDEVDRAWREALGFWNRICGIRLGLIRDLDAAKIWATSGPLPGSTLAWSYLANDNCAARLEQRYDTTHDWTYDVIRKTIGHEIGHAIGLPHTKDKRNLLYPSITNRRWEDYPGPGDLAAVRQRYGPPRPDEPDDPTRQPPGDGITVFIPGGRVLA